MSGPFYTLEDPWCDRRDRGLTTAILYGSGDPHIAEQVADTSCLTGCEKCEYGENREYHAKQARHLVKLLNLGFPRAEVRSALEETP